MTTTACFAPLIAHTGEPLALSMQRLWLTGQILPAGARLTVQHVFRSCETKPIEVIYAFPLPRDAALHSFRISGDGFEAHSELRETEAAVKAYEEGLAKGSLSTLARQYGDGLINLTVGNIQPGEEVTVHLELVAGVELRDDGFRFRFPFTLAPAYHPRARTAVVVPGEGEMELPANEFGDVILPRFKEDASGLHQVGFDLSVTSGVEIDELGSPSHTVRVKRQSGSNSRVSLAAERDIPNRDLVLDAHYPQVAPQILAGNGRFAAIVPSTSFGQQSDAPRRVVILLDRSGSMEGAPLTQAARAIDACLATLSETDSFGLVAFDDRVETCEPHLLKGTKENRDRARRFLQAINARGGTELVRGFQAAVQLLERGGGDVLILTDGQVAGTEQILAEARAANTRLHCLGIGSASQDHFLSLLARETGGVGRFVTASERVDLPAVDLFASIGRPVAVGLKALGNIQPEPPNAVFTGTPVLLFGEASEGFLDLTWDGGGSLRLPVPPGSPEIGETVRLLQGARLITDWESRYPATEALQPLEKRQQSRVAARLRELSPAYGLASREMSLVAVVARAVDRPGQLPETRVVPVGMPQDTRFGAYFHTTPAIGGAMASSVYPGAAPAAMCAPPMPSAIPMPLSAPMKSMSGGSSLLSRVTGAFQRSRMEPPPPPPPRSMEDRLLALASDMDSDGGMPGKTADARAAATVAALFAFVTQGHTSQQGAFRAHVAKLVSFLQKLSGLDAGKKKLVDAALESASKGRAPAGDWLELESNESIWKELTKVLGT